MMTSDCFASSCNLYHNAPLSAYVATHTKLFLMIYVEKLNCRMAIALVFYFLQPLRAVIRSAQRVENFHFNNKFFHLLAGWDSDGGLEDVATVEVLGLREVGGVRQVGDVPGTEVTLRLALRPHQEPLESCPASYRHSGILTPLYTHNHHHFLSSPEVGLRAHLFLVHHNFNRRLTLNTKLVYSGILMFLVPTKTLEFTS